jgi:hypothetical protein
MRETLPTPAPFVFGGTFSDYLKEGHKFRRFSTLASLAKATHDVDDEIPEEEDQIKSFYAEARQEGIGTVDHIEVPEASVNIVNLVAVARFIERKWMPHQSPDSCECEDEFDEEEIEDEDEECEDRSENDEDGAFEDELQSYNSGEDCRVAITTGVLQVASPVVYSGTFQDYKKDSSKFTHFSTLARFSRAARDMEPAVCAALYTEPTAVECDCHGAVPCINQRVTILDTSPAGYVPCQLLALVTPPGLQENETIFATISEGLVNNMIGSTLAGAKVAAKRAVGVYTQPKQAKSKLVGNSHPCEGVSLRSQARVTAAVAPSGPSPYRFKLKEDEIQEFGCTGHLSPRRPPFHKPGAVQKAKDDGSSWIVDDPCISHSRSSGSAWGGGATLLDPICHGKFSLDQPVAVTLSKTSDLPAAISYEQSHEAFLISLGAAGGARSVF